MDKTTVIVVVLFLLMGMLLVGTGCGVPRSDGNVLEFWTIDLHPKFDEYINGILREFEAAHPGWRVRWVDVPINALHQKFIAAIAARRSPDLVNLNTDLALQFAELGALLNLDDVVPDPVRQEYFPGLWQAGYFRSTDGTVGHYAVPWYVTTQLLIYNTTLLSNAGLNPAAPPDTWEKLWEAARTVKARTGTYGIMPSIKFVDELLADGIPVVSPDRRRAVFDVPEAVAKLARYATAYQRDEIPRESIALGKSYQRALELYQGGGLGYLLTGPQFLTRIRDNAPSVYAATEVAPLPVGKAGMIAAATMNLAVPANARHRREAVELALLVTGARHQLRFCRIVPVLPSVKEAARDPFFQVGSRYAGAPIPPDARGAADPAGDPLLAKARYLAARQLEIARDLNLGLPRAKERSDILREMLESALLGRKSPEEALRDGATRWTLLLQ